MKTYTAKTVDECITQACLELAIKEEQLVYKVTEEKKSILGFKKSATINVYTIEDAAEYGSKYLKTALSAMGVEATVDSFIKDNIVHINIESERNPLIIGRNGKTLQALNELVRLAISNNFRHRYRVLIDCGDYKVKKYQRLEHVAKRAAKDVIYTKCDAKLEPMTPDERRIVHNVLNGWKKIKTESYGEGRERAITIKYVGGGSFAKSEENTSKIK